MTTATITSPGTPAPAAVGARGAGRGGRGGGLGWWALAAVVVAAAAVVRVPGMAESLWFDEALRTGVVLGTPRGWRLVLYDVHNPLYNLFMTGWIRLFGDSAFSIRVPSVLAGAGAVLVAARWAAGRFGGAVAWPFAAWALLTPAHVWYSTEAKNTMFVVLMGALVLAAHGRLMAAPSRGRAGAAVLVCTLGVLTDFLVLLAIVPVWLAHAVNLVRRTPPGESASAAMSPDEPLRRREAGRALLWTVVATAALAAPFTLFKLTHAPDLFRGYLRHFEAREVLLLLCGFFTHGNALVPANPGRWIVAAALAPAVGALLALGWRRMDRTRDGRAVNAALGLPIVVYVVVSYIIAGAVGGSRHWIYQERNLLILLVPYGLVLWAGVGAIARPALRRAAAGLVMGLAVAGSVLMGTLYRGEQTVSVPAPDWRGAAAAIAGGEGGEGAGAAPLILLRSHPETLRYYLPGAEVVRLHGEEPGLEGAFAAAREGRPVYAVSNAAGYELTEGDRRRLGERFEAEPVAALGALRVERLRPRTP